MRRREGRPPPAAADESLALAERTGELRSPAETLQSK